MYIGSGRSASVSNIEVSYVHLAALQRQQLEDNICNP